MKNTLVLATALLFFAVAVRAQFTDNFSDGNFTVDPEWQGHTDFFTVNPARQLQSSGPAASSTIYLSTSSTILAEAEWNFFVQLDFTPSSQNYLRIYLSSDNPILTGSLNGYFLQLGGSTTAKESRIELYKQQGASPGAAPPVASRIIQGISGSLSATRNRVRIQVKRDAAGQWILSTDYTGGYSFVMEGSGFDDSIRQSTHAGIVCRHSATRNDKFIFDDFKVGSMKKDTLPPVLQELVVLSPTQLELKFNESLEITSAGDTNNYIINQNIGKPLAAKLNETDPATVYLTFGSSFPDGLSCQLTVADLEDQQGNRMPSSQTTTFVYHAPYQVKTGDIVLNEIMADEDPPVGLPKAEFIELYNTTSKPINLKDFTLSDEAATVSLPDYVLAPKAYLILCATSKVSEFQPFGPVIGISLPNLRNAGELLSLHSAEGTMMDRVHYLQSWYKDANKANGGWTLEKINPYTVCNSASNWSASLHEMGGTPGSENSIYNSRPDTIAPQLINSSLTSPIELSLSFSKSMDSLGLVNGTYQITPSLSIFQVLPTGPEFNAVTLKLSTAVQQGNVYTLTLSNIYDCASNHLSKTSTDFGAGRKAMPYEVVINEILAKESPRVGLPEKEFIELYNTTSDIIDLSECWYADSSSAVKLPHLLLMPHQYLILCATNAENELSRFGKAKGIANWPTLDNGGETLSLRNKDGSLIHTLTYSDTWYGDAAKKAGGWSLEMVDPANPCGGAKNWTASEASAGGTPGKENSVKASNPDLSAPRLVKAIPIDAHTVTLYFDEPLDSLSAVMATYAIQSARADSVTFSLQDPATVSLFLPAALEHGKTYTVAVSGLKDCSGNYISSASQISFVLPEQGKPGDIIINEVLFNANTGGVEFVELFNHSPKAINLKHWQLGSSLQTLKSITATDVILAPKQYVAITKDAQILKNEYPKSREENFLVMPHFPALNNSAGMVVLNSNAEVEIERFAYNEQQHFALLKDKKGVSLERIRPDAPAENPNNWQSAASHAGYATPGYQNSQHLVKQDLASNLFIQPKVFTPNEDGNADFTTINFNFDQGGYVATITVFDSKGREVKKLASNELLGPDGFYRWDGTNDLGRKVGVGYYILLFEIFNLQGQVIQFKETVVVGADF